MASPIPLPFDANMLTTLLKGVGVLALLKYLTSKLDDSNALNISALGSSSASIGHAVIAGITFYFAFYLYNKGYVTIY
jgi:hypothetical protein